MKVTVFYSWQSDLPNNTNRGFIQRALEKAIDSITAQETLVIDPCVERDTAGVPGSPDIASTIFSKMDDCHVFVGDVSIINAKTESGRKTPNPNVLLELGYAAKNLTWSNVICVFNTAFGKTEDLPFDLRLRRMAVYSVSEEQENKAEVRDSLSSFFQSALQPILLRLNQQVQDANAPVPLTPNQASAKVKELLADDRYRIQLSDLVMGQGNELAQRIVCPDPHVQIRLDATEEPLRQRIEHYQEISQIAQAIMIAGCFYGTKAQDKLWIDLLQRVANPQAGMNGTSLLGHHRFPALLLLYSGGLAALAADRYETLLDLLTKPRLYDRYEHERSPLYALSPHQVIDTDSLNKVMGQRWYAPFSEHAVHVLREPTSQSCPGRAAVREMFRPVRAHECSAGGRCNRKHSLYRQIRVALEVS